jgi:hypothetical protein
MGAQDKEGLRFVEAMEKAELDGRKYILLRRRESSSRWWRNTKS